MIRIRTAGVRHVAVMQDKAAVRNMRVFVKVIDAVGVEQRASPLDAVYLVALVQQELAR